MTDFLPINWMAPESRVESTAPPIWQNILLDWHGTRLKPSQEFFLGFNPTSIVFGARFNSPNTPHPQAPAGKFFRGLWEYDVVELFIKQKGKPGYFEFNLSPSGAWWAAEFSDYRKEAREINSAEITTATTNFTTVIIPTDCLSIEVTEKTIENLEGNVTGIRINGTMKEKKYFSFSQRISGTPDFHNAKTLLPLTILKR